MHLAKASCCAVMKSNKTTSTSGNHFPIQQDQSLGTNKAIESSRVIQETLAAIRLNQAGASML
jgi:hypothetical protein